MAEGAGTDVVMVQIFHEGVIYMTTGGIREEQTNGNLQKQRSAWINRVESPKL